ncbi:MAG: hypothetical protein K9H64_20225 [Bacteroidales bacterium]|nr:hypothetical protein [Bacteroidales bacterium]MCF8458379.1 hypothetical protein [Bacteroidales bacterium]
MSSYSRHINIILSVAPFCHILPLRHEDTKVSQREDQSEILLCVSLCLSVFVACFCFLFFNTSHVLLVFEYFVSLLMMLFFLSLPRNPKAANLPQTPFSPHNLEGNVIKPIESAIGDLFSGLQNLIFRGGLRLKKSLNPFQGSCIITDKYPAFSRHCGTSYTGLLIQRHKRCLVITKHPFPKYKSFNLLKN